MKKRTTKPLTTKQLLNLEPQTVRKMSTKELRVAVSTLRSTARKRYERLEKADLMTPSAKTLSKHSPDRGTVLPTVSGMDLTTLRNEYKRYKQFLESKTSTVSGTKKVIASKRQFIEEQTGITDLSDYDVKQLFEMSSELLTAEIGALVSSTDRLDAIAKEYKPNRKKEDILFDAKKRLEEMYERGEKNVYTSAFFDDNTD